MATKKIEIRPKGTGDYADILYPKTSTDMVIDEASGNSVATHLADYVKHPGYATTTGTANTYTVTLNPAPTAYVDGMGIVAKINVASTGVSTLNVNGLGVKTIKDSLGNDITSGGLKANTPYTLRYEATSGNFIVQGKGGGGNAGAGDLLSGKTATVDSGPITGAMPNKVGSATVITPGTADIAIPQGYFGGVVGDGKVKGDANLLAANILSGKSIFGVAGTVVAGKKTASGTSSVTLGSGIYLTVNSLTFTPKTIVVRFRAQSNGYTFQRVYDLNATNNTIYNDYFTGAVIEWYATSSRTLLTAADSFTVNSTGFSCELYGASDTGTAWWYATE